MMIENRIETGALGYLHPGWDEQYYPEGLPEDWRLDYYSHHFRFVLMKPDEWLSSSGDDINQWLQDVTDSFKFFLSIDAVDVNDKVIEQISLIKSGLAGQLQGLVIMQYDSHLPDVIMKALCALTTVHVDTDKTDQLPVEVKPCWRKARPVPGSVIGFLSREESKDIRVMRAYIEDFIKVCDPQQAYLVYEGDPPPSKTMQDAQVILQMLM